jgi:hypothetical protein
MNRTSSFSPGAGSSHRRLLSILGVSLGVGLGLVGCMGRQDGSLGTVASQCRGLTTTAATRPADFKGTVFTVVMENHSDGQIVGNTSEAPYINSLIAQGALASGYHDSYVHPSEPNYIWMVAGENFGILNDADPGPNNVITTTSHLADQIEHAGLTWKTYQESMGAPCQLVSNNLYAVKHNPFAYFADINGWDGKQFNPGERCKSHMVDYSEFDKDLASGTLPDYVFITPNLISDMHDGSTADGDKWLSKEIPKILNSPQFKNGGVLFLLWDEGGGLPQADDPPFIVVGPNVKPGFVSKVNYDTSSFLKTVQTILGVEALPCQAQPDSFRIMDDLFTKPMTAGSASVTASEADATNADGGTADGGTATP